MRVTADRSASLLRRRRQLRSKRILRSFRLVSDRSVSYPDRLADFRVIQIQNRHAETNLMRAIALDILEVSRIFREAPLAVAPGHTPAQNDRLFTAAISTAEDREAWATERFPRYVENDLSYEFDQEACQALTEAVRASPLGAALLLPANAPHRLQLFRRVLAQLCLALPESPPTTPPPPSSPPPHGGDSGGSQPDPLLQGPRRWPPTSRRKYLSLRSSACR